MDKEAVPHHPEADTFDFQASWQSIKQACLGHKWLIASTCLVTVLLVVAYMVVWPPVYHAEVVLVADAEEDAQRDNFYQYWNVFRKDPLPDEVQLMTTGPILERVVNELDLTFEEVYHPFLSYTTYLWTESWLGKTYRRIKEWFFPPKTGPYIPTHEQVKHAWAIRDFKKGVSLDSISESHVGLLVVKGPTPRVAEIADTLVNIYLDERKKRHVEEAESAYESLSREAEKVRAELSALETRMQEYYTDNSLLLMFEKDKVEVSEWLKLKGSIVETRSVIATLEKSLEEVNRQLTVEDKEVTSSRVLQKNNIKDEMVNLQLEYQLALQKFQPDSPEVRAIENEITVVKKLIDEIGDTTEAQKTRVASETYTSLQLRRSNLLTELQGARAGLEVKLKEAERMEKQVGDIPEKMKITHELNRQHDLLEKKYSVLQDKMAVAVVSKAAAESAPPSMRVVEYASLPAKPSWPNTKLLLVLAVVMGLGAGVVLALLLDLIFARVNRYRLQRAGTDYPVYAILEQDKDYLGNLYPSLKADKKVVGL